MPNHWCEPDSMASIKLTATRCVITAFFIITGCSGSADEPQVQTCTPSNDQDPCTHDTCADGITSHTPVIGDPSWYQCSTDITFFAMGDPQYGGGADNKNAFHLSALNQFAGTLWRNELPSAGTPVARPLGLLIAGDLTQNGKDGREEGLGPGRDEIGEFETDYGLTGTEGILNMPVYEGYGNHDFDPDMPDDEFNWRYYYDENPTPSVERVVARNTNRIGLLNTSTGNGGHYSWDWGNVHFVNTNLFAGDEPSQIDETSITRDPRMSLSFLRDDLRLHVGDSNRPVIIMQHYGFDQFGYEERWWTDAHKDDFLQVIRPYNVVLLLHGHTHATYRYEWEGYDALNVGSPYYESYNFDGQGHFTVFRITDTTLEVSDATWSPDNQGQNPQFSGWYLYKSLQPACLPEGLPACISD